MGSPYTRESTPGLVQSPLSQDLLVPLCSHKVFIGGLAPQMPAPHSCIFWGEPQRGGERKSTVVAGRPSSYLRASLGLSPAQAGPALCLAVRQRVAACRAPMKTLPWGCAAPKGLGPASELRSHGAGTPPFLHKLCTLAWVAPGNGDAVCWCKGEC